MSEFDDLARLWQQEPTPEEQALFARLARRTSRRARMVERAEVGVGALLIVGVVAYSIWHSAPAASLLVAAAIIVATIWSSWRRHVLARHARLIGGNDRREILASGVASARASLKRSAIGMVLLVPGFVLGAMLKYSAMNGSLDGILAAEIASWSHPRGRLSHVVVLIVLIYLGQVHLRLRRELKRLETLLGQYRDEARLDGE